MNVALVLASAVLLPIALPNEFLPWGATLPGLVALVPAFLAVYRTPSRKIASRLGLIFGVVSTAIGNYWLAFFGEFSIWTIGGTIVGYAGYNYILFGVLHVLAHTHRTPGLPVGAHRWTMRPLMIAVAWTGYEYLKSVGFLGYPWGLIAYPMAKGNLPAQIAELAGVWGLSFLGAYVNSALAEAVTRAPRSLRDPAVHHLGAVALLGIVVVGFGSWQRPTVVPTETRSMLLVQQNVDSWAPGRFPVALNRAQELTLSALEETSARQEIDAVVWSETALRRPYSRDDSFFATEPPHLPFRRFLQRLEVPLVTGAPMPQGTTGDATNSALIIAPDGDVLGEYGKRQLVPFAESIPFWHVPAVQEFFRERIGIYGTWVPGDHSDPLPLPLRDGRTLMVGTPICFEDGFGWVPREMVNNGAELLINLTNNSWSRQNSAQTQHFAAARLRSIELRTTLVRGTNSGLSTVVDAAGYHHDSLPMFEGVAEVVSVPLYPHRWTLYRAWGDWLGIAAALVTAGMVVRAWWYRRHLPLA
ncbi:MAG: apolipoprotein N-acyltransferase [Alkalispirochaeta sp.]